MKRHWDKLSKREKTLAITAFMILLLVVGQYLFISPFLERRQWVKGQLEIQPQLLDKNLRYLGQKESIAENLEKARAGLRTIEPSLLSGDTPSVSASDLQQTVQALATKEGTQVISTRVLNPDPKGPFTKIPIQVEIGAEIQQIVNLLKGIESSEKLLAVDDLTIRSLFRPVVVGPQRQPTPAALPQNIRVSLIISGFVRSQPPPPKREPAPVKAKPEEGKAAAKSKPR